jgi:hypothetical protein
MRVGFGGIKGLIDWEEGRILGFFNSDMEFWGAFRRTRINFLKKL